MTAPDRQSPFVESAQNACRTRGDLGTSARNISYSMDEGENRLILDPGFPNVGAAKVAEASG